MTAAMPHQAEAVRDITTSPLAHRYLADEQGLGKTITALLCLLAWNVRLALVICPVSAIAVWRKEAGIWLPGVIVLVVTRPRDLARALARVPRDRPCLIVIAYDWLSRLGAGWLHELQLLPLDALVCDEAHRLKSQNARRTQLVLGQRYDLRDSIAEHVPHVLLLSGTPMTAFTADLWAPLHALWPERLWLSHEFRVPMAYPQFVERFCETRVTEWGQQVTGSKNIPELRRRLAGKGPGQNVVIRRTKAALLDLPECRLVTTPLDVVIPPDWDREWSRISDRHIETMADDPEAAAPFASVRARLGEIKLRAALTFISDWLIDNPGQKLIVFGVHRHVLNATANELTALNHEPVLLTGETRTSIRGALVERFQTNPRCRVFVGQLQAAGEAITLHAASTVVLIETDWSATAIAQALARAHRIGQRNRVLGHLLVVPNSFDERVHQVCRRKALAALALWGDELHGSSSDYRARRDRGRGHCGAALAGPPA